MADKLAERKEKIHQAMTGNTPVQSVSNDRVVSDEVLFGHLGKKIKRVK